MQVQIDETRCSGHGRCAALGAAVYDLDELGFAAHRGRGPFDVAPGNEDAARSGAASCPERAIEVLN
jgi:ferredoxin